MTIDRTENCLRIIGVHEGTGPVIDGFAAKGGVVGVHDAVNELGQLPLHQQLGLADDDRLQ